MAVSLPELFKIVDASAGPVTTNGGITCDYVSLKTAHKAWIVVQLTQAVAHATQITPMRATDVAGTGAAVLTSAVRIWANEDTGASDTLVEKTAAVNYAVAADAAKKMVIFEIDPADIGAYDVLGCTLSNSGQATNFASVSYWLQTRYPQATPPSAIID